APPKVAGSAVTGKLDLAAPVEISRTLAIQRFDYFAASDQVMARAMVSLLEQPDFIWTPYPDFVSALHQNTMSIGITHTHTFRPSLTNEARAGYSDDDLHWNRPHSEVPTLGTFDGVTLPGSPAFYAYKNRNRSWEFLDNVIWARGRHLITAGGGLLLRGSEGFLTAGRDGQYQFGSVLNFALDRPAFFRAAIQRTTLPGFLQPDSNRTYRYAQFFGFVQDTFKISSRLTANYGVRYELFGAPEN